MYQYWGFGLHINSELEFPELLPFPFERADLEITLGKTPEKLEGGNVQHKTRISASPTEYLIHVLKIGKYYAAGGNQIIIEPDDSADLESLRLFTLSNAMAAILHQQNKIPLHASAIITSEGLVLFTGRSGVGKSSTAYALMQEGFQLFSDDVCVLMYNKSTSRIEAFASYPMMKLWENTIDEINPALLKEYKIRPHLPKYGFFQHENFTIEKLPIKKAFILHPTATQAELSCTQLDKFKAFNLLQLNTYRRLQVGMMHLHNIHFRMISQLASQADVFLVKRPLSGSDIRSFTDFIKEQLTGYAEK